jgi:hypothetical protein
MTGRREAHRKASNVKEREKCGHVHITVRSDRGQHTANELASHMDRFGAF